VLRKSLPAGSYKLRVSKAFSSTVAGGASKSFTVVVAPAPPTVNNPVLSTASLTPMVVGRPSSATLAARLGTAPYTWSLASGALPVGLSLAPSGIISGRPTVVGTSSFTVRVTDSVGHSGTGSVTATIRPVLVRSWGSNGFDQLGDDPAGGADGIKTAILPASVAAVSGGYRYTLALETDGTVWAWGLNGDGQLGLGDVADRSVPTQIPSLSGIVAIAAGLASSYAVTASGRVYAWGADESGELGIGTANTPSSTPVLSTGLSNVISVAAGAMFALALTGTGGVQAFGNGNDGELGNGLNTPQQASPVSVLNLSNQAVAVSASSTAGYAVLSDGTVRAWGLKEHGQLGHLEPASPSVSDPSPVTVDGLTGVTSLSCTGFEFCLARHGDGTVSAWGYGLDGEMGNGTTADNTTAVVVPQLTNVVAVATAHQSSFALHADGTVSSWGNNGATVLGNGDTNDVATSSPATIPGLSGVVGIDAGEADGYALQVG
jgi:alpha-tubulin suppressor-like RCC1 family protein